LYAWAANKKKHNLITEYLWILKYWNSVKKLKTLKNKLGTLWVWEQIIPKEMNSKFRYSKWQYCTIERNISKYGRKNWFFKILQIF
jgi:hypothetical protein